MGPNLFSRSSGSTGIIILAQPCPACPSTLLLDLFVESHFGWLLFNIDSHNSNSPCDSRKVIRRARGLTEAPQAPARTVDRSSAALDLRPGPAALSRCKRWWYGANRAAGLDSTPQLTQDFGLRPACRFARCTRSTRRLAARSPYSKFPKMPPTRNGPT